tara:strand:- start:65585 stop:66268 length:684 start_codon:yes stop_codon:yes gene_type:complete
MRFLIFFFLLSFFSCIQNNSQDNIIESNSLQINQIDNKITIPDTFFYSTEEINLEDIQVHYCNKSAQEDIVLVSLQLSYIDLEGNHTIGTLIVNKEVSDEVIDIFSDIYDCGFKINKMIPIYYYNCIDDSSMTDNNTSSFNYRTISGSRKLSDHSYGKAIDINPLFNPHVKNNKIMPNKAKKYTERDSSVAGLITSNDCVVKAFKDRGWYWGGDWKYSKDYQHFYKY